MEVEDSPSAYINPSLSSRFAYIKGKTAKKRVAVSIREWIERGTRSRVSVGTEATSLAMAI